MRLSHTHNVDHAAAAAAIPFIQQRFDFEIQQNVAFNLFTYVKEFIRELTHCMCTPFLSPPHPLHLDELCYFTNSTCLFAICILMPFDFVCC